MAIQSQPSRIPEPFAGSGTKNTIPATNATPSASQAASWASGFPPECSQPISAGGCPVPRNDVNGALNQISQDFAFRQDGGIWAWSALADYDAQRMVRGSDGLLYWSVQPSGPGIAAGAVDPTTDDGTYWAAPSVKTMGIDDQSPAAANTQWVKNWANQLQNTVNYYIDSVNGDDTASGTNSSSPIKTMDEFWSRINSSPFVSSLTMVHLEQGEYTLKNNQTKTSLNIIGPSSGYAKINEAVFLENGSTTAISGGRVQFTSNIYVSRSAVLNFTSNPYINFHNLGSVESSIYVYLNGLVSFASGSNATITYSGTNSFFATVRTQTGGRIAFINTSTTISSSGTLTGKRYDCTLNSGVSGSGSTTKFPGSANGGIDSTSYYN